MNQLPPWTQVLLVVAFLAVALPLALWLGIQIGFAVGRQVLP